MLKVVLGISLFTIYLGIYPCDSPATILEKENLIAARKFGLLDPEIVALKLHEIRLRSARKALTAEFLTTNSYCPTCSLRLKTHYGGESGGARWCELNELILGGMLTKLVTRSQMEKWKKERSEIEKGENE